MPVIRLETIIAAPRRIVFDLSRSIDLHKVSTSQTNEEAIAGVTTGLIGLNESVTWRARHFGFYQTLTSKVTEFRSPDCFVDEMEKGIFKRFRHEHIFKIIGTKTMMIDVFDYESPLGILGKTVDGLFLKRYMQTLLEKRNLVIKEYAESGEWNKILRG